MRTIFATEASFVLPWPGNPEINRESDRMNTRLGDGSSCAGTGCSGDSRLELREAQGRGALWPNGKVNGGFFESLELVNGRMIFI